MRQRKGKNEQQQYKYSDTFIHRMIMSEYFTAKKFRLNLDYSVLSLCLRFLAASSNKIRSLKKAKETILS